MKEARDTVLDVLMYLYENYADIEFTDADNHLTLRHELLGAGFPAEEVSHAFDWITGLIERPELPLFAGSGASLRVYACEEQARIPVAGRGFLLYLEQLGLLDAAGRELAIDRLMALPEELDLERVKWVVLRVLMNPPADEATAQLQDLVYAEGQFLH